MERVDSTKLNFQTDPSKGSAVPGKTHTHMCAHTHAPSAKDFHIQLSVPDTSERSPWRYGGVSFQQLLLSLSCPLPVQVMAHQSQLARVPYPAPGQSETTYCCISGPVCYKDLRNWDFIFRSWCFFSSPATPSFQDLLDKRLKLLSQAMVLPVLCRYQSPRTLC